MLLDEDCNMYLVTDKKDKNRELNFQYLKKYLEMLLENMLKFANLDIFNLYKRE